VIASTLIRNKAMAVPRRVSTQILDQNSAKESGKRLKQRELNPGVTLNT
jgi:hypothetical protein